MAFKQANLSLKGRSQLPRGLRRKSMAARLLGLRVRIAPGYGCFSLASVVILEKGHHSSRGVQLSVSVSLSVVTCNTCNKVKQKEAGIRKREKER
jgi:hypothetical protein